jgi:hypothetical protein
MAMALAAARVSENPTNTTDSAPANRAPSSLQPTPGSPIENRPVGTVPVTCTPWSARSNTLTARMDNAITINARGQRLRKRPMSSSATSEVAPTAKVVRLVSGISLIVPMSSWA